MEPTDFKNVIFENIHWALFEVAEVAEVKQPRNSKLLAASEAGGWKVEKWKFSEWDKL